VSKTNGFEMVSPGNYTGTIDGVAVRVVRSSVGVNAYGNASKTAEWKVRGAGRVLADGHQTMSGAIASACAAMGAK
jgi:hypothetical protein